MTNTNSRYQIYGFGFAILCFTWIYLHLLAFWPGFVSYDTTFNAVQFLKTGRSFCDNTWKSYIYGCLQQWSFQSPWGLGLVSILQALFASAIIGYGTYFVATKTQSTKLASFWACVMIFMPLTGFFAIFTERDVVYSWLYFLMMILTYGFFLERPKRILFSSFLLIFVATVLGCLRREGFVPLTLLVLFIPFQFSRYWKGFLWTAVHSSLLFFVLNYGIPKAARIPSSIEAHNLYNVTAYWGALNDIRRNPNSRIFKGDKAFLEAVAPLEQINALKEGEFGGWLIRVPTHQINRMHRTAFRVLVLNFDMFLESRWRVVKGSLFPTEVYNYFHDAPGLVGDYPDLEPHYPQIVAGREDRNLLRTKYFDVQKDKRMNTWQSFFIGPLIGIFGCLLLVLMGFWKRHLLLTFCIPLFSLFSIALTHGSVKPKVYYYLVLLAPMAILIIYQQLRQFSFFTKGGVGLRALLMYRKPVGWVQNYFKKKMAQLAPPDFSWLTGSESRSSEYSFKRMAAPVLKVLLSFFFIFLLTKLRDIDFGVLFSKKPDVLIFSFLLFNQLLMCVISTVKWSAFQNISGDPIPWRRLFTMSWISQSVGLVGFGLLGADGFRAAYLNLYEGKNWSLSIKNVFLDRLASLAGLTIVLLIGAISLIFREMGLVALFLIFAFPKKYRSVIAWGTLLQALKVLSIMTVFLSLDPDMLAVWYQGIFPVSIGLYLELVPVSFEGLGWGHYTFYELFGSQDGTAAYHSFFLAKVAFKLLGVGLLIPTLLHALRMIRRKFQYEAAVN